MCNYDQIMSRIQPLKRKNQRIQPQQLSRKIKKHSNRIVHALELLFPLGHIQKGNSQTVWIRKDIARLHANSRSHTYVCMYHMDKYRLSNKKAGNNRPVNTRISPAEIFRTNKKIVQPPTIKKTMPKEKNTVVTTTCTSKKNVLQDTCYI